MKFALALLAAACLWGCAAPGNIKSSAAPPSQKMVIRAYQLDPQTFWPKFDQVAHLEAKLGEAGSKGNSFSDYNAVAVFNQALRDLFEAKEGISEQPEDLFLNDRKGTVLICGTPHQCETLRRLLVQLDGKPVELDMAQYKLGKIQPINLK